MSTDSSDKTHLEQITEAIDGAEGDPDRHVMEQLNRSLGEAVRAAQRSGKQAVVTLKIIVKPNAERRVLCAATVDAKLPRPPVSPASLYADGMGNLFQSDPKQGRLEFISSRKTEEN